MGVYLSKEYTQAIKGVAIFLVVICHIGNNYTRLFTPLGGIGVSLFLILSAYGLEMSYKKNKLKNFWYKRLKTVFVPYIVLELIMQLTFNSINFATFIMDITLLKPLFPLGWYLNYLMLMYISFWIIKKAFNKDTSLIFVLLSVVFGAVFFFTNNGIRFEQSLAFPIGLLLANVKEGRLEKFFDVRFGLCLIIVAIFFLAIKQIPIIRIDYKSMIFVLDLFVKTFFSCGILMIFYSFYKANKVVKVFNIYKMLGKYSYELYLVHGYALCVFSYFYCGEALCLFLTITIMGVSFLVYIERKTIDSFNKYKLNKF